MKICMVEWVDSSSRHGWHDRDELLKDTSLMMSITVGILTRETNDLVALAFSVGDHGKGDFQCEMTIPKVVIKRMRRLKVEGLAPGP